MLGPSPMFTISEKIIAFLSPDTIEPQALQQLVNTSESPVLAHHLAVMPDCHYGKGSTVGSVIPTSGGIIPAAVGVDIGCGMIAVETIFNASQLPYRFFSEWQEQLGTLGNGNHFVEVCLDEAQYVWLVLHS